MRAIRVATDEECLRYGRARAWPPIAGGSPDAHANFAFSTVLTAPVTALAGTSLVVQGGDGALFPAAPFNAVVCPAGTPPRNANAEIVRVTAKAVDTFTITRGPQAGDPGGVNRSIVVGDQIFVAPTVKTLTDVEAAPAGASHTAGVLSAPGFSATVANLLYVVRLRVANACAITGVMFSIGVTGGNVIASMYNAAGSTKLATSASTAVAGGLSVQHLAFTGQLATTPGDYILGIIFSTATPTISQAIPAMPSASVAQGSFTTPATVGVPAVTSSVNVPVLATY